MNRRIIHTGQAIADIVMYVDTLPQRGGDVFAGSHRIAPGGGCNMMAAAARDGAEVVYVGGFGTGVFADGVKKCLAAEGVVVRSPRNDSHDAGFSVALVEPDGERTFVSATGAEVSVTPEHYRAAGIRDGDIVYATGYTLHHPASRAALLAWLPELSRQTPIVFDTSPMIARIPTLVLETIGPRVQIWTMNEHEATLLLQRIASTEQAPTERAEVVLRLRDLVAASVLMRVGPAGCWVADAEAGGAYLVDGFPSRALDTNGAGDAHTGVLCAALSRGEPLHQAVRRANAAAALAVTRRGPATSPTSAEIDAFLGR